jgi:WD40 repeat protein
MFQSCDGPTIDFYNPNNTNESVENNIDSNPTVNKDVPTENKATSTEVVEKVEEGIQLNLKDLYSNKTFENIDEKKLKAFLDNAYLLVSNAIDSQIRDLYVEDESEEINTKNFTYRSLFKFPAINVDSNNKEDKKKLISDMIWNKSGDTLAVSFYEDMHIGPCAHSGFLKFFVFDSFYSNEEGEEEGGKTIDYKTIDLEVNSCMKCLDSHPRINNIFVAGGFNGEIYYINLSKENSKDFIEFTSKIESAFYKECVISVKFIKYDENVYYIASISQEGRILLWNPEHKLKYPVIGYCLKHKFDRNILQVNPTVFVDNPFESCDFRVGTYDGSLYKCNFKRPNFDSGNVHEIIFMEKKGIVWRNDVRVFISNMRDKDVTEMKNSFEKICKDRRLANLTMEEFLKLRPDVEKIYKNALKLNYERHFSAVSSINFNYFVKNLIVTTSYDGSLRLYHGDEAGLKYFYCQICGKNDNNNQNEEDYYTYSTWSPYKPNILVAGNSRGEIEFGILTNRKKIYNIATIQDNGFSPVIKIVFNPNEMRNQNILTVSYKDGIIELFKLSDSFSQVGMNEIENLSKYISH